MYITCMCVYIHAHTYHTVLTAIPSYWNSANTTSHIFNNLLDLHKKMAEAIKNLSLGKTKIWMKIQVTESLMRNT